jgi:hypothetical protein
MDTQYILRIYMNTDSTFRRLRKCGVPVPRLLWAGAIREESLVNSLETRGYYRDAKYFTPSAPGHYIALRSKRGVGSIGLAIYNTKFHRFVAMLENLTSGAYDVGFTAVSRLARIFPFSPRKKH